MFVCVGRQQSNAVVLRFYVYYTTFQKHILESELPLTLAIFGPTFSASNTSERVVSETRAEGESCASDKTLVNSLSDFMDLLVM